MDEVLKDQLSLFGQLEEPPGETPPKVAADVASAKKASRKGAEKGAKISKPLPAAPRKAAIRAGKGAGRQVATKAPPKTYAAGLVPAGDMRLTINIRQDLHLRLKIAAAHGRTTIGEIIEELVEQYVG